MKLPLFIEKLVKRLPGKGGVKHLSPSRDWLVILALALAALIASVAWNAWFFFIALGEDAAPQAPAAEHSLDTSSIEKARALFEKRAAEEEKYRSEYRFNDPSK